MELRDEKDPNPRCSIETIKTGGLSWDVVAPAPAKRIVVWLRVHYPERVDFDNVSVEKVDRWQDLGRKAQGARRKAQ